MTNEFFDSLKAEFKPKPLETLTKEVFLSPDLLKNADDGLKNKFISVLLQSLCVSGFVFIAKQSNIDANEKLKYIFNELKKFNWFLGVCKSASGKGLHVWTKIVPIANEFKNRKIEYNFII